jgi:iron complex transport system permease protein
MRDAALLFALLVTIALACVAAIAFGSTPLPLSRALAALVGVGDAGDAVVVWQIRLPRALAALLTGMALGLAGAAMQGLLRNPLADPGVLGVSAGASLAATTVLYFGLATAWAWAVPVAAIAGALATTAVLASFAARAGSVVTLILIGVGVSSLAGALMSLLMNLAPNPFSLADLVNWMLGTVANRSFAELGLAAPFLALGAGVLLLARRGLSALTLGEEAASAVGLDLGKARLAIITGTGLLVGGAVSLAGAVGFVGLVAPHLVRPLVGHDPARTLLPAALLGGLVLLVADLLVRVAPTDSELKLGVVAALIGAPVFIAIAARRGRADG